MKSLLIVANFKSHFTLLEAKNWLSKISGNKERLENLTDKKIIVCPSFTLLETFKNYIFDENLPFAIGAQNVSSRPQGAFTGEVNGAQVKDFADYVIIGHSERRNWFGEDESVVEEKVKIALEYKLIPILCIQNAENTIPQGVSVVAYEPTFAIGSGNPDNPQDAQAVAKKIIEKTKLSAILYGGSVTPENVKGFTNMENINGVLVGTDSLDPDKFLKIAENA